VPTRPAASGRLVEQQVAALEAELNKLKLQQPEAAA
jgi:hypothetical protein